MTKSSKVNSSYDNKSDVVLSLLSISVALQAASENIIAAESREKALARMVKIEKPKNAPYKCPIGPEVPIPQPQI